MGREPSAPIELGRRGREWRRGVETLRRGEAFATTGRGNCCPSERTRQGYYGRMAVVLEWLARRRRQASGWAGTSTRLPEPTATTTTSTPPPFPRHDLRRPAIALLCRVRPAACLPPDPSPRSRAPLPGQDRLARPRSPPAQTTQLSTQPHSRPLTPGLCPLVQLDRPQVDRPCPHGHQPEDARQPPRALQGQEAPARPPCQEDPCHPPPSHQGASLQLRLAKSLGAPLADRRPPPPCRLGTCPTCSTSAPRPLSARTRRRSTSRLASTS